MPYGALSPVLNRGYLHGHLGHRFRHRHRVMILPTLSPAHSARKYLKHGLYWNSISAFTWRTRSPVHTVEQNFVGDPRVVTISESFMSLRCFLESPCRNTRVFCCSFLKDAWVLLFCYCDIEFHYFWWLLNVLWFSLLYVCYEVLLSSLLNSASCSHRLSAHKHYQRSVLGNYHISVKCAWVFSWPWLPVCVYTWV